MRNVLCDAERSELTNIPNAIAPNALRIESYGKDDKATLGPFGTNLPNR